MQSVTYDAPDTGQLYLVAPRRCPSTPIRRSRSGSPDRDALDIAALFAKFPRAHVLPALINEQVTPESLAHARAFLARATVDDTVVVFIAGHGILSPDASAEFLFVPYAFDRAPPARPAIPFSTLEALVQDTLARRRLLLIDSCAFGGPR